MERVIFQKKKKMYAIARRYGLSIATIYRIQAGTAPKKNPKYTLVRKELAALEPAGNQDADGLSVVFVIRDAHCTSHTVAFYQAAKEYCTVQKIQLFQTEEKYLSEFLSTHFVDGIISLTVLTDVPEKIPVVCLNCHTLADHASGVCVAGMENWFRMVQYLKDTGSKRIGVFFPNEHTSDSYYLRKGAFQPDIFCRFAGIDRKSGLFYTCPLDTEHHEQIMSKVADHFLSLKQPLDAILTDVDEYLPGIAFHLQKKGIRIPKDVRLAAVYGLMDKTPPSSTTTEKMYQIDKWKKEFPFIFGSYPCREMAIRAIQLLIEKIRDPDVLPSITEFSTKIINTKQNERKTK